MTQSGWADRNFEKVVNDTVHIAMQREHRIVLFTLAHHWGATIAVPRNQIFEVHFFHLRQRKASDTRRHVLPSSVHVACTQDCN
jgi:hypothetical protein